MIGVAAMQRQAAPVAPIRQRDVALDEAIAQLARELGPLTLPQRIAVARILEAFAGDYESGSRLHRW